MWDVCPGHNAVGNPAGCCWPFIEIQAVRGRRAERHRRLQRCSHGAGSGRQKRQPYLRRRDPALRVQHRLDDRRVGLGEQRARQAGEAMAYRPGSDAVAGVPRVDQFDEHRGGEVRRGEDAAVRAQRQQAARRMGRRRRAPRTRPAGPPEASIVSASIPPTAYLMPITPWRSASRRMASADSCCPVRYGTW